MLLLPLMRLVIVSYFFVTFCLVVILILGVVATPMGTTVWLAVLFHFDHVHRVCNHTGVLYLVLGGLV